MRLHEENMGGVKKKLYILKLCGSTCLAPHLARAGCGLCGAGLNEQAG